MKTASFNISELESLFFPKEVLDALKIPVSFSELLFFNDYPAPVSAPAGAQGLQGLPGPSTTRNVSESTEQKIILWGSPGNEIARIVSPDFAPDSDVTAYLNVIETAKGSYVSGTQFAAIHAFVASEKAAGRWTLHKRVYLPIWGNSGANAVDLITATSGSWVNNSAMIHAAGYVQNTLHGHFDTGVSPSSLGITDATNWVITLLLKTKDSRSFAFGSDTLSTGSSEMGIQRNSGNTSGLGPQYVTAADSEFTGIYLAGRESGTAFLKYIRAAGVITTTTVASAGTYIPSTANIIFTGLNNNGSTDYELTAQVGHYGISLGMSQANADGYLANLKTLWETSTGLSLP